MSKIIFGYTYLDILKIYSKYFFCFHQWRPVSLGRLGQKIIFLNMDDKSLMRTYCLCCLQSVDTFPSQYTHDVFKTSCFNVGKTFLRVCLLPAEIYISFLERNYLKIFYLWCFPNAPTSDIFCCRFFNFLKMGPKRKATKI